MESTRVLRSYGSGEYALRNIGGLKMTTDNPIAIVKRMIQCALPFLRSIGLSCLGLAVTGCGSGGNDCPNLAGTWQVTEHFVSSQVGQTTEITQSGCTITMKTAGNAAAISSVVSSDGRLSWKSGSTTCVGQAVGDIITMDCMSSSGGGQVVTKRK